MLCTSSEKPEQETMADKLLLNRRSLGTCPPELRQSLAYVLHLRSRWKPEGRDKLIVPASWMEFLAFADGKCGMECVANQRCPFRNVQFQDVVPPLAIPDEELPRDVVSRVLTNCGIDAGLATVFPRALEGIPRTSTTSDVPPTMGQPNAIRSLCIDFALVPGHDVLSEDDIRCLLFGVKEHPPSTSFDSRSGPPTASIPEELIGYGRFHLTLLASLINLKGGPLEITPRSFPEWLVLFGLLYDAHHFRVIAYLPRRLDIIDCVAYMVDELTLPPDFMLAHSGVPVSSCEHALERLRLLLALTSLRRHVLHLSKLLFTTIGPRDGIGKYGRPSLHADDSASLRRSRCASLGSSLHSSSQYSTCPSSVHARDILIEISSCHSFASSFCSTCSSLLASDSTSDSFYSEDSEYTDSNHYMGPSVVCPNDLTETKRQEIITWAHGVSPTEHPVRDTYKMVANHPHSRRRKDRD